MEETASELGLVALASGLTLYLEGSELAAVTQALRYDDWLIVQWERRGLSGNFTEELVREARWRKPDAWLLVMPSRRAIARLTSIRAHEGALPVVVVSTSPERAEAAVLVAGADLYCHWPAEATILAARVHALLRRASGTYRIASRTCVELSQSAQQLCVDGTEVRLSGTEYRVLARLDASRNEWLAPSELWPLLTSADHRYDSSLLRTHLLRIRQKLGTARWVLRTERGRGVMLTDQRSSLIPQVESFSTLDMVATEATASSGSDHD